MSNAEITKIIFTCTFLNGNVDHSLKFNVGTSGIRQLPQTTGDGIHSLLQEVVWDVGDNVPKPVLQLL